LDREGIDMVISILSTKRLEQANSQHGTDIRQKKKGKGIDGAISMFSLTTT
jgi:hypothetical protein